MKMVKLYRTYRYFGRISPEFKLRYKSFWQFLSKAIWGRLVEFQTYDTQENLGYEECAYTIVEIDKGKNEVNLIDLFVAHPFRRRGYATTAIRSLMRTFETEGYSRLNVRLGSEHVIAKSMFVRRLGFHVDVVRTNKLLFDRAEKDKKEINPDSLDIVYYTLLG